MCLSSYGLWMSGGARWPDPAGCRPVNAVQHLYRLGGVASRRQLLAVAGRGEVDQALRSGRSSVTHAGATPCLLPTWGSAPRARSAASPPIGRPRPAGAGRRSSRTPSRRSPCHASGRCPRIDAPEWSCTGRSCPSTTWTDRAPRLGAPWTWSTTAPAGAGGGLVRLARQPSAHSGRTPGATTTWLVLLGYTGAPLRVGGRRCMTPATSAHPHRRRALVDAQAQLVGAAPSPAALTGRCAGRPT